ncbi:MAG: hypothetical protein IPJ07_09725 [Acidobacteria bacterium]|nr:hypothetical protein [Acidobacteriota bacterium]
MNGVTWQGWIEVSNGTIASIAPLGADHFTDKFVRTDFRRVWFVCKTRGDFDGVMAHPDRCSVGYSGEGPHYFSQTRRGASGR